MRRLDPSGETVEPPEDLRGKLLAATPLIGDGTFDRTVLFIVEHNDDGALAVILTRPLELPVAELLPRWGEKVAEPATMFSGGPVNTEAVVALAELASGSAVPDGLHPVEAFPHAATIDLDADPTLTLAAASQTRLFLGYAGWTPGQLEGEIESGAWFVFEAEAADLFDSDPHELRQRVFARQRNRHRIFGHFPDDPSFN